MATINILHEEDGNTSTVSVNLQTAILSDGDATRDSYLIISTTLKDSLGAAFPTFLVKDLADSAPGYPTATDFTDLVNGYVEYFMDQAGLGQSTSSSTSSEGYSESSTSSSSSEGYSESSSSEGYSESSSSDGYSESSSSSEMYSESSSSSEMYSESSSSS